MQGLTQSLPTAAHCYTNTGKVDFPGSIFTAWKAEKRRERPAGLQTSYVRHASHSSRWTAFTGKDIHAPLLLCPVHPLHSKRTGWGQDSEIRTHTLEVLPCLSREGKDASHSACGFGICHTFCCKTCFTERTVCFKILDK